MVNEFRSSEKAQDVFFDETLYRSAVKAVDYMISGTFNHRPGTFDSLNGYKNLAENIYKGNYPISKSAQSAFDGFKKSELHRINMENKVFNRIGIAYKVYKGTQYWAQVYGAK